MNLKLIIAILAIWALGVTSYIVVRPAPAELTPTAEATARVQVLEAENKALTDQNALLTAQVAELNENVKAIREAMQKKKTGDFITPYTPVGGNPKF